MEISFINVTFLHKRLTLFSGLFLRLMFLKIILMPKRQCSQVACSAPLPHPMLRDWRGSQKRPVKRHTQLLVSKKWQVTDRGGAHSRRGEKPTNPQISARSDSACSLRSPLPLSVAQAWRSQKLQPKVLMAKTGKPTCTLLSSNRVTNLEALEISF